MLNLVYHESQDEKIYRVLSRRLRDKFDIFGGLPDTIEDEWITTEEELEARMDEYLHLRQQSRDAFELRYKPTIDPEANRWERCSRVLARNDVVNFLSGQQVAIAARIPAEAVWSEPWAKGWAGPPRGYAQATFVVGGKRLAVYGLHLKSNLGNPAENTSKRDDAIAQLLDHIRTGRDRVPIPDAVIIGGDFNTDDPDSPGAQSPGERTFALLRKASFHWSFDGIALKDRITCPGEGRYPDACFDYFFTRGLGRPVSSVKQATGSDHLPVVMEVVVR